MPAFSSPSSTSPNQVLNALSPISLRSRSQTRTQCASSSFRPAASSISAPATLLSSYAAFLLPRIGAWIRFTSVSTEVPLPSIPLSRRAWPAYPGALKAVCHIETRTVAGRGHGFRRRGRSSPTPTKKEQRGRLVRQRTRECGDEFRIGLHAREDLPFDQRRLLVERGEVGQADEVPFGARATRRSEPHPYVHRESSRPLLALTSPA